jgi:hypothetical protein
MPNLISYYMLLSLPNVFSFVAVDLRRQVRAPDSRQPPSSTRICRGVSESSVAWTKDKSDCDLSWQKMAERSNGTQMKFTRAKFHNHNTSDASENDSQVLAS